jgi:predicted RNase H-like HicB family nuclease
MTQTQYKISTRFDQQENGFISWVPALNDVAAFGQTEQESVKNVKKVMRDYLKFLTANKKPIPKPDV